MLNLKNIANFFVIAISVVVVLTLGRNLLIPFVFALLLWFVVKQIRFFMDRWTMIKKWVPIWIKYLVSFFIILTAINFVFNIVIANIRLLIMTYHKYESNVNVLITKINDTFHINLVEHLQIYFEGVDFGTVLLSAFSFSTDILTKVFMVIIYALFIFLEEPSFKTKLFILFPDKDQFDSTYDIIHKIEVSISKYLGLKTLISLITATLSYLVLMLLGVDFPVFWAFLIFVLNYIPNIGSIVATLFPVVFCFLQFGSFVQGFLVLLFVGAIQFFIGNILDPKLMGNSVNLSPLVIILSLSFWGAIWGITGMLLSVPIMVIVVIILSKFPNSKPLAILLSGDGVVE